MLRILLSLTLASAVVGCASEPVVDVLVTRFRPEPSTLMEQRARLDLRIQNLSDTPIEATGVTLKLRVNGRRLAQGADNRGFTVPRLGDATTSVVVSASVLDTLQQLLALPNATSFAYVVKGSIFTRGAARRFRREGEISRADLQTIAPLGAAPINPVPASP